MSDYKGAALVLPAIPKAKELLADKGYDADWFRAALAKRGVNGCIPSKSNRKVAIPYDALLYKQRHKIDIDRAWRLSRFTDGRKRAGRRRQAAPRQRCRPSRFEIGHGGGVGRDELRVHAADLDRAAA